MFTCRALKIERRLGHQLFQIAATIGAARKYGVEWVLPTWSCSSYFQHLAPQTTFPLHIDAILTPEHWEDVGAAFISDRFVVDLSGDGNFHDDRFFRHCDDEVRRVFEPNAQLRATVAQRYANFLAAGRSCVVVTGKGTSAAARREFCERAIAELPPDAHFAVMSEDADWWKEQVPSHRLVHLARNEIVPNFVLGLLCRDVMVVDSPFGWWIARLNQQEGHRFMLSASPETRP